MNSDTTGEADTLSYCRSGVDGQVTSELEHSVDDARVFSIGNLLEDRYMLKATLGSGGFGQVFRAADQRLDRDVAIKVLVHDRDLTDANRQLGWE